MYGERHALKSRLEELNHAEERTIRNYQEERERIYSRLRKLDEGERFFSSNAMDIENEQKDPSESELSVEQLHKMVVVLTKELDETKEALKQNQILNRNESTTEQENNPEPTKIEKRQTAKSRQAKQKNKVPDYTPVYKEALNILKRHTASIKSVELKKELETKMGIEIPNMTNFMERLIKKNPSIEKPYRGQYLLRQEEDKRTDIEQPDDPSLSQYEARNQLEEQEQQQVDKQKEEETA